MFVFSSGLFDGTSTIKRDVSSYETVSRQKKVRTKFVHLCTARFWNIVRPDSNGCTEFFRFSRILNVLWIGKTSEYQTNTRCAGRTHSIRKRIRRAAFGWVIRSRYDEANVYGTFFVRSFYPAEFHVR